MQNNNDYYQSILNNFEIPADAITNINYDQITNWPSDNTNVILADGSWAKITTSQIITNSIDVTDLNNQSLTNKLLIITNTGLIQWDILDSSNWNPTLSYNKLINFPYTLNKFLYSDGTTQYVSFTQLIDQISNLQIPDLTITYSKLNLANGDIPFIKITVPNNAILDSMINSLSFSKLTALPSYFIYNGSSLQYITNVQIQDNSIDYLKISSVSWPSGFLYNGLGKLYITNSDIVDNTINLAKILVTNTSANVLYGDLTYGKVTNSQINNTTIDSIKLSATGYSGLGNKFLCDNNTWTTISTPSTDQTIIAGENILSGNILRYNPIDGKAYKINIPTASTNNYLIKLQDDSICSNIKNNTLDSLRSYGILFMRQLSTIYFDQCNYYLIFYINYFSGNYCVQIINISANGKIQYITNEIILSLGATFSTYSVQDICISPNTSKFIILLNNGSFNYVYCASISSDFTFTMQSGGPIQLNTINDVGGFLFTTSSNDKFVACISYNQTIKNVLIDATNINSLVFSSTLISTNSKTASLNNMSIVQPNTDQYIIFYQDQASLTNMRYYYFGATVASNTLNLYGEAYLGYTIANPCRISAQTMISAATSTIWVAYNYSGTLKNSSLQIDTSTHALTLWNNLTISTNYYSNYFQMIKLYIPNITSRQCILLLSNGDGNLYFDVIKSTSINDVTFADWTGIQTSLFKFPTLTYNVGSIQAICHTYTNQNGNYTNYIMVYYYLNSNSQSFPKYMLLQYQNNNSPYDMYDIYNYLGIATSTTTIGNTLSYCPPGGYANYTNSLDIGKKIYIDIQSSNPTYSGKYGAIGIVISSNKIKLYDKILEEQIFNIFQKTPSTITFPNYFCYNGSSKQYILDTDFTTNSINANKLVNNSITTTQIASNTIVNSNISTSAAISISKLQGYPSSTTLFLRGDSTWTTPPGDLSGNNIQFNSVTNYLRSGTTTTLTGTTVYGCTTTGTFFMESSISEACGIFTCSANDNLVLMTAGDSNSYTNWQDEDATTGTRVSYVDAVGNYQVISCRKRKHSIMDKNNNNILDRIMNIKIKSYGMKYEELNNPNISQKKYNRIINKSKKQCMGVIMEEIYNIFPNCVSEYRNELQDNLIDDIKVKNKKPTKKFNQKLEEIDDLNTGVDYQKLNLYHIMAFQEYVNKTNAIIDNLQNRIKLLESKINI